MAIIYITKGGAESETNETIYKELITGLNNLGHDVMLPDRENPKLNLRKSVLHADVIIPFLTNSSLKLDYFSNEILQLKNYSVHKNKLFLPVYNSDLDVNKLPEALLTSVLKGIRLTAGLSIKNLTAKIDESINLYLGERIATEEKVQEIKENIKLSAPTFIEPTIQELRDRESSLKSFALWCYVLGFITILSGVCVAAWFFQNTTDSMDWAKTVFYSVKSIFIVVLLLAASNYCFNLAKSFMAESLRVADRIHAISFGKFYLQVFNEQIDPDQLKEIFRDWNINNQSSSFSSQTSKDHDPMILDKLILFTEKLKGGGDK